MSERWRAQPDEMRVRRVLSDRVGTELPRSEREWGISGFADRDRYQLFTYAPTMVKTVLVHDYANIDWIYIGVPEERNRRVESITEVQKTEARAKIEGIQATLPVGTLSVKGAVRTNDGVSGVMKSPESSKKVEEVFSDG